MQSVPNDLLAATAAILTNAWLFESFLFKSKEPAERATLTAATIFIVLAIISGIGFRDHEPFGVL
ncbi:MAG TPA: hypothetical protein VLA37_12920, partial [Sphingomonadaceae bacterium]|nr:hypothetical protein [Sphingomonadaceae bacterium]